MASHWCTALWACCAVCLVNVADGSRPPLAVGTSPSQQSLASLRIVTEVPLAQQSLASLKVLLSSARARQEPDLRAKIEQEIQERIHAEDAMKGKATPDVPEPAVETPVVVEMPAKATTPVATKISQPASEEPVANEAVPTEVHPKKESENVQRWGALPGLHHSSDPTIVSRRLKKHPHCEGDDAILIFWAVGAEDRVINLVRSNLAHLRATFDCRVDVMLAHYDLKKQDWVDRDPVWYHENVQFSAVRKGYKFQLMQGLLTSKSHFDLSPYTWVWALDEDVDFTSTDLNEMIRLADASGALLALPAFTELGATAAERELDYPMQSPRPSCQYRYTPVVEVIFPLIRAAALEPILTDCEHCIHGKSTWGLDRVWCSWAARYLNQNRATSCAVLDATPVLHRNFKTLTAKYAGTNGAEANPASPVIPVNPQFMATAKADYDDVEKLHPDDFVPGRAKAIEALACVGFDGEVRVAGAMSRMRQLVGEMHQEAAATATKRFRTSEGK